MRVGDFPKIFLGKRPLHRGHLFQTSYSPLAHFLNGNGTFKPEVDVSRLKKKKKKKFFKCKRPRGVWTFEMSVSQT